MQRRRLLSRLLIGITASAVLAGITPGTAAGPGEGAVHPSAASPVASGVPWAGEPTLIGGTARYDAGEWIYTDFVYDDYGADTTPGGQPNVVSLAPSAGNFRYPAGSQYLNNAADIVEVRVRISPQDPDDLEVRVLLQTIAAPEVVALWVDLDGSETIVTEGSAAIDPDANTVTFTLPGAAASGDDVLLNIGAGLHDGQGGLRAGVTGTAYTQPNEFTTGGPTGARLFDLAFNTHAIEGRGGAWNENEQARLLQAGDLSPFAQQVSVEMLAEETTTPVPALTGYFVRVFESRQDLGEGVASSFPQYRGRWQPYAVWVPDGYEPGTPVPLFLNMHSLSVHHNQYRGGDAPSASFPTLYEQFEEAIGAIVVTPLARGPDGWYQGEALVDTLEVWADALSNYTIDPERIYVGGYSMGGYGTYRLATLMPDSFAAAVSIVGPPASGIWAYPAPPTTGEGNPTNTYPQLENTRHVPFWITQGALDELVPVSGVTRQAMRFGEIGHTYRYALHPAADHFSFVFKDDWVRESSWLASHSSRVTDPHRVTLKVRPAGWAAGASSGTILSHLEALTAEVGARLDGAYWVGEVAVASGADVTGFVDLASEAISTRRTGVDEVAGVGIDGPSPYVLTGQDAVTGVSLPAQALTGHLTGVTALTVDVGRAGFAVDVPDVTGVTTDPGASVTVTFVRDGASVGQVQITG